MQRFIQSCGRRIHWIALGAGIVLVPLGGVLSASLVGLVIGGPMLLIAWQLLSKSVTPRPCT